MEDFGYQKDREDKQGTNFNRQIFLGIATVISIALFIYITLTAYHFVYQDEENVELIKATHVPIRISMEEENNKNNNNVQIDRTIYEDIFGSKKEAVKTDNTKVVNTPETALPPKKEIIEKNSTIEKIPAINEPQGIIINNNPPLKENNIVEKKIINSDSFASIEPSSNQSLGNNNLENENIGSNSTNLKNQKIVERKKIIRVQIAAMSSRELAEDQWKKLLRMNPDLFVNLRNVIQKVDLGKRGIFYRLQIGDFFNQIEAESFCQKYIMQTQKSRADCIVVE